MRLRCEACGCYVSFKQAPFQELFDNNWWTMHVQPCKRCLTAARLLTAKRVKKAMKWRGFE